MRDPLDVSLQDDELLAELDLTTSLIIAASATPGRMDAVELDRLLGVRASTPAQRPPEPPRGQARPRASRPAESGVARCVSAAVPATVVCHGAG